MLEKEKELYEFGQFRLDVAERFLARSDTNERVQLSEKAFETLCVLVRNAGHLVNKNELLNQVWADSFVEENNLNKSIHAVRRALGEKPGEKQFIETIKKHGFRFVVEVRRVKLEKTADAFNQENGFQAKTLSAKFPRLLEQPETQETVVSPTSRGNETNGNDAVKQISPSNTPAESSEQNTGLESVSAKPSSENKHLPKHRLPLAAFSLAAFLIGAIGLGWYFFYAGKTAVGDKKSIAVLPLKPINTANHDEIYEIGIADSLILKLSSMKGFVVRPLSATRKYADIEQDAITAGKEQQVDYVLASNYQLAGGKIRVTSQLFNVASGQVEETYKSEKDAGNIFAMQDAIAGEVGNILLARFAVTSSNPTAKRGTNNEEAYRLYLQGRNLTSNRTAVATRKAVEYLEQAIRLDPNYALAYSGMAHAYITSGNLGGGLPREEYEKAKAAVTKALELNNNLAEGYAVLGELKFTYEWDFAGAEKDLLHAVELEPNSDLAHERYAFYLSVRGRFDEAIAESKTTLEINPNSLQHQQIDGVILYRARRYDEAIIQLRRVIEVDENHATAYIWLSLAYEMKGDDAGAYEWFMKGQKRNNSEHIGLFQNAYETSGWRGVRQKFFEQQKLNEQKQSANLYAMARQCALLGDKEQAFAYLNKAIEKHQGQMIQLNVEPAFDLLRDDPRFDELVRRVGLK
jgi:DNA-binding winged helix-turn-helix (wHTH) protein/TolB-like protein/Flp pilus assembly protein TadD